MNLVRTTLLLLSLPLATQAQENLVANPSFEEGVDVEGVPVGWALRVPEGVEVRADDGHSGECYVHIVDQAADAGQFVESTRVPCRPGGAVHGCRLVPDRRHLPAGHIPELLRPPGHARAQFLCTRCRPY